MMVVKRDCLTVMFAYTEVIWSEEVVSVYTAFMF